MKKEAVVQVGGRVCAMRGERRCDLQKAPASPWRGKQKAAAIKDSAAQLFTLAIVTWGVAVHVQDTV